MSLDKLWVEAYRPKTLAEYVFKDETHRKLIEGWIKDHSIPHLLLHGSAGTGKTTLARVLINELDIHDGDVMFIEASKENGVDIIRNKITNFSETMPWGSFKIILMDEFDYCTPEAQGALRSTMERYSSVVRFILTCNYFNRITEPIRSRCQVLHIANHDIVEFTTRAAQILLDNNVKFTLPVLDTYVKASYPDMRKTLNNLQQNVIDGTLIDPSETEVGSDWKISMVNAFKAGKIREGRKIICSNATAEDYDGIFKFFYGNLDMFSDTEEGQDEAIVIIRNGMVKHVSCADSELNISATLVELSRINK